MVSNLGKYSKEARAFLFFIFFYFLGVVGLELTLTRLVHVG